VAYLPDVGETMAQLLEKRDALDAFALFHASRATIPEAFSASPSSIAST
jgi:hypothetical protein